MAVRDAIEPRPLGGKGALWFQWPVHPEGMEIEWNDMSVPYTYTDAFLPAGAVLLGSLEVLLLSEADGTCVSCPDQEQYEPDLRAVAFAFGANSIRSDQSPAKLSGSIGSVPTWME